MMNTLGNRIKTARGKAGLSQRKLAEILNIAYQTLNKYERGHRIPDADTLRQIANITKENPGWLLMGDAKEETIHGIGKKASYPEEREEYIAKLIDIFRGKNKYNIEAIKTNIVAFWKSKDMDMEAETETAQPPVLKRKGKGGADG